MQHYAILLILIIFINGCTSSHSEEQKISSTSQPTFNAIPDDSLIALGREFDQSFQGLFNESGVPGAALTVVKDGFPILLKGYGYRAADKKNKVNQYTKFRLGSVSKTFAALTAAKVVESGKVQWDTPIKKFVPDFSLTPQSQTDRVFLKHILSHTSGLPPHAYTNLLEAGQSILEIAPKLAEVKHVKTEGENFAYQNSAYALVEPFLSAATGKSYEELLDEFIFDPARMENASTSYAALQQANNVASPHRAVGKKGKFRKIKLSNKYYNAVSAGGINASIKDMSEYLKILLGHRPDIASETMLENIFEPRIQTNFERRYFDKWKGTKKAEYALGWRVLDYKGRQLIYHGGFVNGFRSEIFIDPKEDIGACLMVNSACPLASNFVPNFFKFYDAYLQQQDEKNTGITKS